MDKYPIDPKDETVCWGRVKKNLYWGRKCGGLPNEKAKCHPVNPGQYVFKTKKWKNGVNNSGK